MNTNLSSSAPSQLETECLVVVALDRSEKDHAEKDKPVVEVECADGAVRDAAKDVISSGEVTAKSFETTLLHRPAGLKAKRLLLVGGGKAQNFSAAELRKLAGAAVRTLKGKSIRSFAFALPEKGIPRPKPCAPSSKAPSSATSSPGITKVIARTRTMTMTRRSTPLRSWCQAIPSRWKVPCKPRTSSPSRRTSPVTSSTSPPIA